MTRIGPEKSLYGGKIQKYGGSVRVKICFLKMTYAVWNIRNAHFQFECKSYLCNKLLFAFNITDAVDKYDAFLGV